VRRISSRVAPGPTPARKNGGTSIALDTYKLARERGYAPIDVPQVFTASVGYELPLGPATGRQIQFGLKLYF